MIIGKGDIAKILNDRKEAIFFASGVSNSNETNESEYEREKKLLSIQDKTKCIFYFSSISVDDINKHSRYIKHKIEMEEIIKSNFQNYNIIRIGNIIWGNNPNTFINFINNKVKNYEPVVIKDEFKYIINKEELLLLTDNLPLTGKNIISVFSKMAKVKDLL
jgi:hypothetical protein